MRQKPLPLVVFQSPEITRMHCKHENHDTHRGSVFFLNSNILEGSLEVEVTWVTLYVAFENLAFANAALAL